VDTATLTFERRHAIDAPFADVDDWYDALTPGLCTACGCDAWSGLSGWWHADGRMLCPDRAMRTPGFSPDI
jgi:hypothetical protein